MQKKKVKEDLTFETTSEIRSLRGEKVMVCKGPKYSKPWRVLLAGFGINGRKY
jgi:hypothetical protein